MKLEACHVLAVNDMCTNTSTHTTTMSNTGIDCFRELIIKLAGWLLDEPGSIFSLKKSDYFSNIYIYIYIYIYIKQDGNYTKMLQALLNKSLKQYPTKPLLYGHLPPISQVI